jgi:hypothetical protein
MASKQAIVKQYDVLLWSIHAGANVIVKTVGAPNLVRQHVQGTVSHIEKMLYVVAVSIMPSLVDWSVCSRNMHDTLTCS